MDHSSEDYTIPAGYREAAGCIVKRQADGKILLLRRSALETSWWGMFELPGGKLEAAETAIDTAQIETKEEAGIDVEVIQRLSSHVDDHLKKVYHVFLANLEKDQTVSISEEHDEFMWVSVKDALALPKPIKEEEATGTLSHHARHGLEFILQ